MKEQDVKKYFDKMAPERDKWKKKSGYYYSYLENFISFIVPENKRVLEIGCGTGDLLFKLKPSFGLGVDISDSMIELAKGKNSNPKIEFKAGTIDDVEGLFDYVILSDLIGYLPDIEDFFRKLSRIVHPQSKIVITQYSQLWEPVLSLASKT
ncbi:MAG: class I SAM-dependent methyltransferase, partial [Patescibacteria group bacterium]